MKTKEAIAAAIKAIEKQFGKGAVVAMGGGERMEVKTFSSGSLGLDRALGCGGIPLGRIIEVYGPESSGKTTMALHMIAEAQKAGYVAAFVDAEHALDITYARKLGVKEDELLISQPDCGEQALDIAATLCAIAGVGIIVVDSVAALVPKAELEGDMGDQHVGRQARLMSQAMRKLTSVAARSGASVLFINQLRQKIGVTFGSPETTTGGNALKFYSSIRLDVRRIGGLKAGDDNIGNRIRVKVVKNKLAPPFRTTEADLIFGKGVDRTAELIDHGVDNGIVEKAGAWFSYGEQRLGKGKKAAADFLTENPEIIAEVEARLWAIWNAPNAAAA